MAIRAIVFDLGGVLEIERDTGTDTKWEARLNLKPGEMSERFMSSGLGKDATLGNLSEEEMFQKFCEVYGMSHAQMQDYWNDIWEDYTVNQELATYFQSLRPRYRTAILSNGIPGARREETTRFHFDEMADLLIYSYEEKAAKPQKRIFEITCERLGVQPEEMIFLDDVEKTIHAAREFGIHAFHFQNTTQAITDVQACLKANSL
jgi:putative hydrolase of the HAD superfamily